MNGEATARGLADDVILSNLDAEASTRLSNDNTLQSNLDSEVASRISAVSAEATARSDADNASQKLPVSGLALMLSLRALVLI